ncbi:MAG TPA: dTMP kinase [Bacteroidales bacterium]|nr:dTMP kinase [Bacteroidales bacterium]HCI56170.1 dTMP kinase [Bacteroidales bacterium]HOU95244.1 dTMP kinase [Bacteroidales bacterium]HQG35580.1 dTMP kinase [Bacteroidales bacterium]HQG51890.1 dTMP kinase [Bacteroidales bacterium]
MKLFVIEGLDGSGKTTQIKLLKDFFEEQGLLSEHIHFPRTDTPWFGELIARFLRGEFGSLNKVDPYLVAMLYAGDRKDAAPLINEWLNENKAVLIDRYTYSNIAYQCAKIKDKEGQNKLKNWIFKLEFEYFAIPKPSINIFLDVPFYFTKDKLTSGRNGSDRKYLNGQNDIHESNLIFQMRVREMYLKVAENDPSLTVINCADSDGRMLCPEKIFGMITELLKEKELI